MEEDQVVNAFAITQESPFPVIVVSVVKGELEGMLSSSIVAYRQVLFEVEGGMIDAAMALFAITYYVFMYQYTGSLNNVFAYLQKCKCIFQFPDIRKFPTSVIAFANSLNFNRNAKD